MSTEPTTEAGRSMLYDWQKRRTHPPTDARQEAYRAFILAIEAEAVQAWLASPDAERELAAALERLPPASQWRDGKHGYGYIGKPGRNLASAILAALQEKRDPGE